MVRKEIRQGDTSHTLKKQKLRPKDPQGGWITKYDNGGPDKNRTSLYPNLMIQGAREGRTQKQKRKSSDAEKTFFFKPRDFIQFGKATSVVNNCGWTSTSDEWEEISSPAQTNKKQIKYLEQTFSNANQEAVMGHDPRETEMSNRISPGLWAGEAALAKSKDAGRLSSLSDTAETSWPRGLELRNRHHGASWCHHCSRDRCVCLEKQEDRSLIQTAH